MIRYHARWVVPISEPPIADGVVAVDGERIAFVGELNEAPLGEDVDLGDVLLMPGLVNAHCHLELTVMRGFLEDLDFRRWIVRLTGARRAVLNEEAMLDSARYGILEGVRAGITTYADTCESGVVAKAMREAGVRGIMYQEVFGPDPRQCDASIDGLREKVGRLRNLESPLVRIGISPHAPYTVSDDLFRAATKLARDENLPMAIHIAESEFEHSYVSEGTGPFADGLRAREIAVVPRAETPIRLLEQLGVLGASPLLIHCVRVNEQDLQLIAGANAPIAHCPVSNAKLGHGVARLGEMLAAGIIVGLGSDSMASNNRMDLLEEARVALLNQRARIGSWESPSAAEVLEMATIGGACALGLGDVIGTLDVGKQADLAAFRLDRTRPYFDPVTAAVFSMNGACADFVTVAGRPLVEYGKAVEREGHAGLDARIQLLAEQLAAWLASGGEIM